jgi:hypothetical protein
MKLAISLTMAVLIGLCFTPAWAQDNELDEGVFGTSNQSTFLTAWDFSPTVNFGTPLFDFDQYGVFNFIERWNRRVSPDQDEIGVWAGSIRLPDGARLVNVKLYAYDSAGNADVLAGNADIEILVRREVLYNTSQPQNTVWGPVDTNTTGGYTTVTLPVGVNIDNTRTIYWIRIDTNATAGFESGLLAGDFRHRIIGARMLWRRQLQTYDPDQQTFGDVPPTDPYFNAVESLFAAGITVGCQGPPNRLFCADSDITRKELAVWLYKALGLHFGD